MKSSTLTRLIHFLQEELGISATAVAIAQRLYSERINKRVHQTLTLREQEQNSPSLLPIILWQYGLVTLEQLDQILDWLETV